MFTQAELDSLIDAMRTNGVTSLAVEAKDQKLQLDLDPARMASDPLSKPAAVRASAAKSPCIGCFVPRGNDDGLPPLVLPAVVEAGEILGYVALRQMRVAVAAPASGTVKGDVPREGAIFGYGDKVFSLQVTS